MRAANQTGDGDRGDIDIIETVPLMRALLGVAVAIFLSAAPLFAAPNDVLVAIRDGRATVIAKDATVSGILAAWARTGLTTIITETS
jgi:hypothetical protein